MTAQTLLTFFAIGATFAILPLAFALRRAWRRVTACNWRIATLKHQAADDRAAICALQADIHRMTAPPCEPPPGCVGATATSRADRAGLADLCSRASMAPWRVTSDPVGDFWLLAEGPVMPRIGCMPSEGAHAIANAELAALARNALPDLLDDVETLLGDVERLQAAHAETIADRNALRAEGDSLRMALAAAERRV